MWPDNVFLPSAKTQESLTNFENPHFAILDMLNVLIVKSDIPQSPRNENHKVNSLQAQTHRNLFKITKKVHRKQCSEAN